MELIEQLRAALAAPPGAHPTLVAPAVEALLSRKIRAHDLDLGHTPEALDAALRHLTGGRSWAPEAAAAPMVHSFDEALELAFRDGGTLAEVEVITKNNGSAAGRILRARLGRDPQDALFAFAERSVNAVEKHAVLCAALACGPSQPGAENALELRTVGDLPLRQRFLEQLGVERASAFVDRLLTTGDKLDAAVTVFDCFGPPLSSETQARLGAQVEEAFRQQPMNRGWEFIGQRLVLSKAWSAALTFMASRVAHDAGWRRAIRTVLVAAVSSGFVLSPDLEEFIDPVSAAAWHEDTEGAVLLLGALPPARAAELLLHAKFEPPRERLKFLPPHLRRDALDLAVQLHVALRDDAEAKHLLALAPFGHLEEAGAAFQAALAEVKPKKGYLKLLQSNLAPEAFQALEQWLETRPEPKKPKAAKKKAGD